MQVTMRTEYTSLVEFLQRAPAVVRFAELTFKPCLGPATKYPGDWHITLSTGSRAWVGRLGKNGLLYMAQQFQEQYAPLIKSYASDPLGKAKEYAAATGNCSFCGLELTDPRSVEVGYGPICADKFGLPWGDAPAPQAPHFKPEIVEQAQAQQQQLDSRWTPVATNAVVPLSWLLHLKAQLADLTSEIDRVIAATESQSKEQEL